MPKINKKRIFICLGILLVIFIFVFLLYKPVIFQEGNPTPLIKGIIRLNFTQDKIVKLNMEGDRYLTKSKNGQEVLANLLNAQDYEFIDQMGSGYFFKDENDNAVLATHRYYSRFYSIWSLVVTKNTEESIEWVDYADELKECLPKSDTASHEKCNELLKQITDYDSCVDAGFSIMKSNPPQCATPDGRTFIENK